MAVMEIEDQIVTSDGPRPSTVREWSVGTGDCHISVAPPLRSDGVAMMLVALGDAGIGVSHIEPRVDSSGLYRLTVDDIPDLAMRILEGIGCPQPHFRRRAEEKAQRGCGPNQAGGIHAIPYQGTLMGDSGDEIASLLTGAPRLDRDPPRAMRGWRPIA